MKQANSIGVLVLQICIVYVAQSHSTAKSNISLTNILSLTGASLVKKQLNASVPVVGGNSSTTASLTTTTLAATTPTTVQTPVVNGTTTEINNGTSGVPPIDSPPSPAQSKRVLLSGKYFCVCDEKVNVCDLNCCCDIDCTDEMLAAFKCDAKTKWEQSRVPNLYHDYGLPSCDSDAGLFCLLKDNSERKPGTFDSTLRERDTAKWPSYSNTANTDIKLDESKFFRSNDEIILVNEFDQSLRRMTIPFSLTSGHCHIDVPLRFLKNIVSRCLMSRTELNDAHNLFWMQLNEMQILSSPSNVNGDADDDSNPFLPVLSNCLIASNEEEQCEILNGTVFEQDFDESMVLSDIKIYFHHNYTNLKASNIIFVFANMSDITDGDLNEDDEYMLRFSVKFLSTGESVHTRVASGSIGYVQAKPILFAKRHFANVSVDEWQLNYFLKPDHSDFRPDSDRLKLPNSRNGVCLNRTASSTTINFGENVLFKCRVLLDPDEYATVDIKSNHTATCERIQRTIFAYMSPNLLAVANNPYNKSSELDLFVSMLGMPRNDTAKWAPVKLYFPSDYDKMVGTFDSADTIVTNSERGQLICRNMIVHIHHKIYFARERVADVDCQNVVHEMRVELGPQQIFKFTIGAEPMYVPIFIDARFYDLTSYR